MNYNFEVCMDHILDLWPIYETKDGDECLYGLYRKFNPDWEAWIVLDKLKEQHTSPSNDLLSINLEGYARTYYRSEYWNRFSLGEMPCGVDFFMFDTILHLGETRAIKALQAAMEVEETGTLSEDDLKLLKVALPHTVVRKVLVERMKQYLDAERDHRDMYMDLWVFRALDAFHTAEELIDG